MNKEDFERSEAVLYWMDSLKGRDAVVSTKYQWKLCLRKFCNWLDKTPDELIDECKQELKSDDDRIRHRAEMIVKRYMRVLEEKGLAPNVRATVEETILQQSEVSISATMLSLSSSEETAQNS